ncbi:MAG: Hpt domain-containing protein [Longimicrobiales bacterium]|nr:Hpt domain-containing protein [Longimicrobiales bacterium]
MMKDLPLLDLAQMERLNEWGGSELKRKMIGLFLTHAVERLDQIREGVSAGSPEKAEAGAHTLKSSAGNVGAQRVQMLARDAEALAEAGNLDELKALFPSLEGEFHAACGALKDVLEGMEG